MLLRGITISGCSHPRFSKIFQVFLKPTELCFRWQGQVASIGGENIYLNVQMLMQKNFGHPSQRTWNLFAELMMDDLIMNYLP